MQKTLGVLSKQELKDKLPVIFSVYESIYGAGRPDVHIVSAERYGFSSSHYSMGSWHKYFAVRGDQVREIVLTYDMGNLVGLQGVDLQPDEMLIDCLCGNLNIVYLVIHPANENKLITQGDDLTADERILLNAFLGLKAFAREEGYYSKKYGFMEARKAQSDNPGEYKALVQALASRGYLKIASNGATSITLKGKNAVIQTHRPGSY
jgi:hypothetical protein